MMSLRILLFTAWLLPISLLMASSDGGRDAAMALNPEAVSVIQARLNLSDEQALEVARILQQQQIDEQAAFQRHDINPNAGRAAPRPSRTELFALAGDLLPIRERTHDALLDLLTKEQMSEWQRYELERFNQLQRRLRGRR